MTGIKVSPATASDVDAIVATIEASREDRSMFLRSRSDVTKHLPDFIVAKNPEARVLGCAAVHEYTLTNAEILSVSVLPGCQGLRVGQLLVESAIEKARGREDVRVWLATSKPGYFARFGFVPFSRWDLPASVLLAKLRQVFQQPPRRWIPALFGRYTFMELPIPREVG